VRGHEALLLRGRPRNLKQYGLKRLRDLLLRRRTPPVETFVWHCAQSNKLYALDCEMSHLNPHVPHDVLDSIECHV
jgi:hypothetical protein